MGLDATGRNALFKIHVTLGKIVNSLAEKDTREESVLRGGSVMRDSVRGESVPLGDSNRSRAGSVESKKSRGPEVIMDNRIKMESVEEDVEENAEGEDVNESEGTVVADQEKTIVPPDEEESLLEQQLQDSLVESLLDDDGDIEMGM